MNNCQCECGLCCATWDDWANHRQATGHEQYREVTIEKLTNEALKSIKGLETFKNTLHSKGPGAS